MKPLIDVDEFKRKLEQMEGRLKLAAVDAKKTGMEMEEKRKDALTDLERRLGDAKQRLAQIEGASAEVAQNAVREFHKAWEELQVHVDRILHTPSD